MSSERWHELGPFTVFDVETTGMAPASERIVELAAVRIDRDGAIRRFQSLVNPGRPIPAAAHNVHRISDAMVADAPPFSRIARPFLDFAAESTLVAHNAGFDLGFLQESLNRCGLPLWPGKTLDTLRLIRKTHGTLASYSLQSLRQVFVLDDPPDGAAAHRAAADAEWTLQILKIALCAILDRQR
jgi:DNA polymerase III epsilon subunit family exonuclease